MTTLSIATVAVCLVRGWVHCYTLGLPAALREARCAEIESDLWEHQRHRTLTGGHPAETAAEICGRWLRGLPADLVWR